MTPPIPRWLRTALTSVAPLAAVTAVIALLDLRVPAPGLAELYLFAVVPIALVHGMAVAGAVSVASAMAFNYFFLSPRHSLNPGASEQWQVLVAFLAVSLVVSHLAARSQREARQLTRLADEQAALRRVATLVAQGVPSSELFAAVTGEVGRLLRADLAGMLHRPTPADVGERDASRLTTTAAPRSNIRSVIGRRRASLLRPTSYRA